MSERDFWFYRYSNGGRFKSWPANWKGWVAMLALLLGELAVLAASYLLIDDRGLRPVILFVSLIVAGGIAVWLSFAKGKRVSSLNPQL